MRKIMLLFISIALVFLVAACGGTQDAGNGASTSDNSGNASSGEKVKIKLSHGANADHPWHLASQKFAEEVNQASNGEIEVEIYTSGQLGSDREVLESTQSGTIQMSVITTLTMSGFDKSFQIYDLPYLFPDNESAYQVLDSDIGEQVASNLPSIGLRNLAYWENEYRQLSNSVKVIDSVDDLKGMKIRTPSTPVLISWLESIGAIPTPIAYTELYAALEQGVVDGQDNGILITYTNKFYEPQKYYTLTKHIYAPAAFLINEEFYQSLSDEHRAIIEQAAKDARDYQREANKELLDQRLEELKGLGLEITELSDEAFDGFRKSAEPIYEQYRNEIDYDLLQQMLEMINNG